ADDGTAIVIDALVGMVRYAAKPIGEPRVVTFVTTAPERGFELTIADSVNFARTEPVSDPTLTMPAEAFVRLVSGRLDAAHTPASVRGDMAALDGLRPVFPGF